MNDEGDEAACMRRIVFTRLQKLRALICGDLVNESRPGGNSVLCLLFTGVLPFTLVNSALNASAIA